MKKELICFFVLILFLIPIISAATIYAASPELTDVQAAINSANPGDTVYVPAGSATWGGSLSLNKAIRVLGAGAGNTIIYRGGGEALVMTGGDNRFSGFTLDRGDITVRGQGWRIDHIDMAPDDTNTYIRAEKRSGSGDPVGLIDNCNLTATRVVIISATLLNHAAWAEPSAIGTGNAVYIEDCYWTRYAGGNMIDANYGGRYVVRYNRMEVGSGSGVPWECHSVQGNNRAARSWEFYENTVTAVGSRWCIALLRAGTGVVFNNTFDGNFNVWGFALDNIRSFAPIDHYSFPPGVATGLPPDNSLWDGNTEPYETYEGWPARDQIGRGQDKWLWTSENPYPPQASEPAYFWNNTRVSNGAAVVPFIHNTGGRTLKHLVEGRDFIVGVPRPGYTPYTYPHPLRLEGNGEPPSDTTPPIRSSGFPSGNLSAGTNSTTIGLTTNEVATCRYSTTAGISYNAMTNNFSTTGSTTHSQLITGLTNGNLYNYYVRCIDSYGNANTNDYLISFSVSPSPEIVTLQDMLGAYQQYKRNEVGILYFLDKLRRWIVFW